MRAKIFVNWEVGALPACLGTPGWDGGGRWVIRVLCSFLIESNLLFFNSAFHPNKPSQAG